MADSVISGGTKRECTFARYESGDWGKENQNILKLSFGKSVSLLGVCTIRAVESHWQTTWSVLGRDMVGCAGGEGGLWVLGFPEEPAFLSRKAKVLERHSYPMRRPVKCCFRPAHRWFDLESIKIQTKFLIGWTSIFSSPPERSS